MAVAAPTRRYTIPDLADFPDDGKLRALVDGQIVERDGATPRQSLLELALGLDVLPGFTIRLRDLLDELAEEEPQS